MTKKILDNKTFTILADKGYYHAKDLAYCSLKGMTLYLIKQVYSNNTGDKDFYQDYFTYDKDHLTLS